MQIEQIRNIYSSTPTSRTTDTYTTWVDPRTLKHEYIHSQLTYMVYDRKGKLHEEQMIKRLDRTA